MRAIGAAGINVFTVTNEKNFCIVKGNAFRFEVFKAVCRTG